MSSVFMWLLILTVLSCLCAPIGFRFFAKWANRGVGFYLPLSLILAGFVFWIFGVLGFVPNSTGGMVIALIVSGAVSAVCLRRDGGAFFVWLRENYRTVLFYALIFCVGFGLMILFRGANPDVSGTEKPMEMMFISNILRSETLPPADGWLSGYAISYYYFGYLMTALLIRLTGVPAAVGFNLMLATVFGMAAVGSFELVNEFLLAKRQAGSDRNRIRFGALWAPAFLLLTGNLEGLFESLHALKLFWNSDGTSAFWKFIGLKELTDAPIGAATINPTGRPGIWWWRASRVIQDIGLDGSEREVIDEFPFFSFYLGDLHPHVLAIPFVLLAVGAAWAVYRKALAEETAEFASLRDAVFGWKRLAVRSDFWLTALIVGGCLFVNTWDFPFVFLLTVAAFALGIRRGLNPFPAFLRSAIWTAIPFGAACMALYGLFMEGLATQAGGLLPSGVFTTRLIHLLIMFGALLIPILIWLIRKAYRSVDRETRRVVFQWGALILTVLTIVTVGIFCFMTEISKGTGGLSEIGRLFISNQGGADSLNPFAAFLSRRALTLGTTLGLAFLIALAVCLLMCSRDEMNLEQQQLLPAYDLAPDRFTALMVALAGALILVPEFFYLRDFFGTRMNTIFKFYYLAWILLSVAAAYAVNRLRLTLAGWRKITFRIVLFFLVFSAGVYPFWGIQSKLSALNGTGKFSLDGAAFVERGRPDDWATIEWLRSAPYGVIVEKVGGSYSADNVFSIFSGLQTILGPMNHESQWRGGYAEIGSRNDDVRQIYESKDWRLVSELLARYAVRYVVIGSAERASYQVSERKFETHLTKVFESGSNRVYFVK